MVYISLHHERRASRQHLRPVCPAFLVVSSLLAQSTSRALHWSQPRAPRYLWTAGRSVCPPFSSVDGPIDWLVQRAADLGSSCWSAAPQCAITRTALPSRPGRCRSAASAAARETIRCLRRHSRPARPLLRLLLRGLTGPFIWARLQSLALQRSQQYLLLFCTLHIFSMAGVFAQYATS